MNKIDKQKEDILKELNEQQRLPVVDYHGPSFVLAVPGAGKTKMLVSRCQYMIADGVLPEKILMFTFTKKASGEMRERVQKAIGEKAANITIRTYHSFCSNMLRKYVDDYLPEYTRSFSIFDTEDKKDILKSIIKNYEGAEVRDAANKISYWRDNLMSPKEALQSAQEEADATGYDTPVILAQIYQHYHNTMRSLNAMDFDSLLYYFIYILENNEEVRKAMVRKYDYIMNDETQDSNYTNLHLIELLADPDKFKVCCVGDIDQSIYGFRGSDIPAVNDFIHRHKMQIFELGRNYRSTQHIFNGARSVIQHNNNTFKEEPFTKNELGEPIIYFACKNTTDEGSRVARLLLGLKSKKNFMFDDMAVLYRMSYQSRIIEENLLKNGIQYDIVGGTPFYGRKEIKDLLSYIRFITNPHDKLAFERAIQVPKRGIGPANLSKIVSVLDDILKKECITSCVNEQDSVIISVTEGLSALSSELKGKAKNGLESFIFVIVKLSKLMEEDNPQSLLESLVLDLDYERYIEDYCEKNKKDKENADTEERMKNIEELIELSASFSSLEEFLQNMMLTSELSDQNESEVSDDKLHLMTMHASKGLEFDAVVIVGVNEGLCPHYKATEAKDIQEERRLFYVAMTRARKILCLSRPGVTIVNGLSTIGLPSRFVKEIDKTCLVKVK